MRSGDSAALDFAVAMIEGNQYEGTIGIGNVLLPELG